ncbi:MAG: hypothetical protein WC960_05510 [Bacteroidales bacterium]
MEESYRAAIESLKERIYLIVSKCESLSAENRSLTQKLSLCKEQLESSNNKIKELENIKNRLELAEAFKISSTNVKDAKNKIGKIINEIEKCIVLLSD